MTRSTHIRNGPFPMASKTPARTSSTVNSRKAIDSKSVVELLLDSQSILSRLQLIWKEKVNDLNSLKTIGSIQLDKQANDEVSALNIEPNPAEILLLGSFPSVRLCHRSDRTSTFDQHGQIRRTATDEHSVDESDRSASNALPNCSC